MISAVVFRILLPQVRVGARKLIVAQEMAAGIPPQEAVGRSVALDTE
jgi:hypothetical protein